MSRRCSKGQSGELQQFRFCMQLNFAISAAAGATYHTSSCYFALEVASLLTSLAALAASDVDFGFPDMGLRRRRVHQVLCLWVFASITFALWLSASASNLGAALCMLTILPAVLVGVRGWPLLVAAPVLMAAGYALPGGVAMHFEGALAIVACSCTRYLADERQVFRIMAQPILVFALASRAWQSGGHWSALAGLVVLYCNSLRGRQQRQLPPGLQKVKFVRLGYLRQLAARGQGIRRHQELPKEAFGDPSKATHIISVSHRWLDERTCDVRTKAHPCGLKLQSLLRRLEGCFSAEALCGGGSSCTQHWNLATRLHAACFIGGWDALVFFDFMSVPQEGLNADGSKLDRTTSENAIFNECLPNMGVLYSLFPVLALTDVPDGDTSHDYFNSGWCVCEFSVAALGQQLHKYSSELLDTQAGTKRALIECSSHPMGTDDAQKFQCYITSELSTLNFKHDSDRMVAEGIVKSFLRKRMATEGQALSQD